MKNIIWLLISAAVSAVNAQPAKRSIAFAAGENLQNNIISTSIRTFERKGQNPLIIKMADTVVKYYNVTGVSGVGCTFNITVKKIASGMDAAGQHMQFNSDQPSDSVSKIIQSYRAMLHRLTTVSTDLKGNITSVVNSRAEGDSKKTAADITVPDPVIIGSNFELGVNLPSGDIKRGTSWADSLITDNGNRVINYTVSSISNSRMTISFGGTIVIKASSSDNGIALVKDLQGSFTGKIELDVATGIVLNKLFKSQVKGYIDIAGNRLSTTTTETWEETILKQ